MTVFLTVFINKSKFNLAFLITLRHTTRFLWLEVLTVLVNNTINIFLIIPNIILYYVRFIKYLWISKMSLVPMGLKLTEKCFTIPFNPAFFILLIVKSFEISLK